MGRNVRSTYDRVMKRISDSSLPLSYFAMIFIASTVRVLSHLEFEFTQTKESPRFNKKYDLATRYPVYSPRVVHPAEEGLCPVDYYYYY